MVGVKTRPYKLGFVTHGPPPEAAPNATNSWAASNRQLDGCGPSLSRKSWWEPRGEGASSAAGPGPRLDFSAWAVQRSTVGDRNLPSWTGSVLILGPILGALPDIILYPMALRPHGTRPRGLGQGPRNPIAGPAAQMSPQDRGG